MGDSMLVKDDRPHIEPRVTRISVDSTSSEPSMKDNLQSVGITDLLDLDDRPTFILDLKQAPRAGPVYHNGALRNLKLIGMNVEKSVVDSFANGTEDSKIVAFLEWSVLPAELVKVYAQYCGIQWYAKTLRSRWRVISGIIGNSFNDDLVTSSSEIPRLSRQYTVPIPSKHQRKPSISSTASETLRETFDTNLAAFRLHREDRIPTIPSLDGRFEPTHDTNDGVYESLGTFDFTGPNPSRNLSPHVQFVLGFDWASTELGPISSWSRDLRRMVNILMSDPRPAALYWGKARTVMYNEPYILVTGHKHPGMMGQTFNVAWAEVLDDFSPAFDVVYETGVSHVRNDARFYLNRTGYLEETYYTISIIPFTVEGGDLAFYNPVFDTTRQVIADRRMAFLLRLGQCIAASREPKDFWKQLLQGLDIENPDLPFALLYSAGGDINETLSISSEQSANLRNWILEGSVKVPAACTIPRRRFGTDDALDDFIPNFTQMIKSDSATLLQLGNGTLPEFIAKEIPVLDGNETCEAAVLLPIRSTSDNVVGFLILGINPWKRYDDDYSIFIELLSRQLATSMASALLLEEEIRHGRMVAEQADRDRTMLSTKLAIRTHEATEIESRFRRMADLAPVGMFHIDSEGVLLYANENYYGLTEHPRNVQYPMSWYNVIVDDDHPLMDIEWAKLIGGETVSFELRLRRSFVAEEFAGGEKVEGSTWILAAAYPERSPDGTVSGVLGCITDISRQKWAEGFQNRKMLEAIQLKQQQERFIDITSHEMRNPLSAIIQSADHIGLSIAEYSHESRDITLPAEVIESYADSAQTIILCAQHQTRIIDDILTLSKLDSDLLMITPVESQPISVIETTLKMFSGEIRRGDIDFKFNIEESYTDHSVDWVKLDPSRLLQVLINLLTNAIKFTQPEQTRRIELSIGASLELPVTRVQYLPRGVRKDMSQGAGWGDGEVIYLYIEVKDTGRGLDDHERNLLFKRFSQSSPRTHVTYGGSGLGLFISRELTELQGGQIGVSSEAGIGSTFAFYVRSRRCDIPAGSRTATQIKMQNQTRIIGSNELSRIQNSPTPQRPRPFSQKTQGASITPKYILIVEDNIVNQKVLSKQLRTAGCKVAVANHGREALDYLEQSRFWIGKENTGHDLSVVLMDLEMPIMDGLTCVKIIRELQKEGKLTAHIPVIAVTANARTEQITTAKEAGMDSVVTKPFRIPELMPEIERQLSGYERRGSLGERSISAPPPM